MAVPAPSCYDSAKGETPMQKTVVCFGDSNTYGTPPMIDLDDSRRFGREALADA